MYDRWTKLATELESGDADRVNEAIDEIDDMDLEERLDLFDVCFDELTELYGAADNGYIRQSLVRVAERLVPGIPTVMVCENDDRAIGADETELRGQTDALCGFLLEAITDDDGRVRQAAKRGFKDVCRTYDALEDDETIEALVAELDEMASEATGTREKHLRKAKEDALFSRQSGIARILEGFQDELGDSRHEIE